jgi:hypothetical protein
MVASMIEFGIADQPILRGGEWFIIGRCVTDISVGETFKTFVPILAIKHDPSSRVKYSRLSALPVNLTIVRLIAYRRELSTLSAGMTAEIVARGDGSNMSKIGSLCG